MAHRLKRRVPLAKRIARPITRTVRRKRAERKRRQVAAERLWASVPKHGVKVPRAKGGGRTQPWSASEAQMMLAKRNLKAREQAHRNRLAGKPRPKCGSNNGYHAHIERGETTCQPCRDAHAKYNRAHR